MNIKKKLAIAFAAALMLIAPVAHSASARGFSQWKGELRIMHFPVVVALPGSRYLPKGCLPGSCAGWPAPRPGFRRDDGSRSFVETHSLSYTVTKSGQHMVRVLRPDGVAYFISLPTDIASMPKTPLPDGEQLDVATPIGNGVYKAWIAMAVAINSQEDVEREIASNADLSFHYSRIHSGEVASVIEANDGDGIYLIVTPKNVQKFKFANIYTYPLDKLFK